MLSIEYNPKQGVGKKARRSRHGRSELPAAASRLPQDCVLTNLRSAAALPKCRAKPLISLRVRIRMEGVFIMKKVISALWHAIICFFTHFSPTPNKETNNNANDLGITVEKGDIQTEFEEETPAGYKCKRKTIMHGDKLHLSSEEAKLINHN